MIGRQICISRNLKEPPSVKVRRAFWALVYFCRAIRCGFSALKREQLGSAVIYRGRKCFVSNWAGSDSPTLSAHGFYEQNCDRTEIKNVRSVREFVNRFKFGMRFYLTSWHDIDVNNRLYGRVPSGREGWRMLGL